jgi:hypothetical protein
LPVEADHEPQEPVVYVVQLVPELAVNKVAEPQPSQLTADEVKQVELQSGSATGVPSLVVEYVVQPEPALAVYVVVVRVKEVLFPQVSE